MSNIHLGRNLTEILLERVNKLEYSLQWEETGATGETHANKDSTTNTQFDQSGNETRVQTAHQQTRSVNLKYNIKYTMHNE